MKNYIPLLFFLLTTIVLLGQTTSTKYDSLIKKADTFYWTKNYKTSALTYSQAFNLKKGKVPIEERYKAACSWALAGIVDSSFFQLNYITTKGNYTNYQQISSEINFKSLQSDVRWVPILERVKRNKQEQEAKLNKPLIKELESIRIEDQKDRSTIDSIGEKYGFNSKEMNRLLNVIHKKDSMNLIRVKEILNTYGWLGTDVIGLDGNTTLFLIIQHSDQKTQENYLPMIRDAVKNGKAKASHLALLEDRVALGQGKKQIYGSQINTDSKTGKHTLAPIEDFDNVDKRRAEAGLEPLENYVSHFGIILNKKGEKSINLKRISNDIVTAEEIKDSIVGPFNVSIGIGEQLDFKLNDCQERNSAWFKFTVKKDTVLTFDIVGIDTYDDFDFIVFKCKNSDCIYDIRTNKVKPDRGSFGNNCSYSTRNSTGLSEYSTEVWADFNKKKCSGYVTGLPVKAGETIYLMVTLTFNVEYTKGFTIYFYNYWPDKPILKRTAIVLENVLFEPGKSILLKESYVSLDKLVTQLQTNKTMKIEIIGHTDNVGDETQNQKLSEVRAKAVVDYLISKKIEKTRLSYKGFGSKQPIASNETEEGRKKNRRVEFVVLEK